MEEKRRYRRGGWHETQIGGVGRCLHGFFRYSEAGISKTLYRKRLKQASSLVTATRSAQSLSCSSCTHRAPNLKASFLQKACSCSCVAPSKPVGRPSSLNVILQKRERPGCFFLEAGGGRGCRLLAGMIHYNPNKWSSMFGVRGSVLPVSIRRTTVAVSSTHQFSGDMTNHDDLA